MSRRELMTFLKATKPNHGIRNLSVLSKPELQSIAQQLLDHPKGGNFFSDLWSGIKKGAEIVSKPLEVLQAIPGFGQAVIAPIRTVTEAIKGSGKRLASEHLLGPGGLPPFRENETGIFSAGGKMKKVRIKIKNRGAFKPFGYEHVQDLSIQRRHQALDRVIASGAMKPIQVWHRLNALMVFNKKNPNLYKIFREDRDYVKKMYMLGRGFYGASPLIQGGCAYCHGKCRGGCAMCGGTCGAGRTYG